MDLVADNLTAGYPGHTAVRDVSLGVREGEVTVVVGPNGCGKSTLLRCMARLHRPAGGCVRVGGADVWRLRPRAVARRVSLLPQVPEAPEGITAAGLVRFGRHPHQGLLRQWSSRDEAAVTRAMADAGITDLADRRLDRLSGGQRQRCWLALALAQDTPVMLLDEPISMLDLGHQVEVLGVIRHLAAGGRAVVMVLHDLTTAARYADTLVAMRDGRIVDHGPPRATVTPALIRTLYGVDADILAAPGDGAPVVVPRHERAGRGGDAEESSADAGVAACTSEKGTPP
ncbi:ABC transporter ATP-binding protein [Aquisalimonas lutea]|uniref:ABC transporter ATP-binding protein n=1 Tax=Aquisalimonas lutea TaxID=1327750 RepID=UPI0025B39F59|nr:ABC transporter ATP-binding protein [Aquisalimonas lutea]MDN3518861.1 ABC transporter ATP-binding protein [Aquisalimonas lutea]